jgi:hypothetical protein
MSDETKVVTLHQPFAPDEIPATLRRIADQIEKGEYGVVTTCLVVTGHTSDKPMPDGDKLQQERYELFGCGPRCDAFTVRGLLLTVATRELNGGE